MTSFASALYSFQVIMMQAINLLISWCQDTFKPYIRHWLDRKCYAQFSAC